MTKAEAVAVAEEMATWRIQGGQVQHMLCSWGRGGWNSPSSRGNRSRSHNRSYGNRSHNRSRSHSRSRSCSLSYRGICF